MPNLKTLVSVAALSVLGFFSTRAQDSLATEKKDTTAQKKGFMERFNDTGLSINFDGNGAYLQWAKSSFKKAEKLSFLHLRGGMLNFQGGSRQGSMRYTIYGSDGAKQNNTQGSPTTIIGLGPSFGNSKFIVNTAAGYRLGSGGFAYGANGSVLLGAKRSMPTVISAGLMFVDENLSQLHTQAMTDFSKKKDRQSLVTIGASSILKEGANNRPDTRVQRAFAEAEQTLLNKNKLSLTGVFGTHCHLENDASKNGGGGTVGLLVNLQGVKKIDNYKIGPSFTYDSKDGMILSLEIRRVLPKFNL